MPKYQHKQQSALYKTSKQKGAWAEDIACKWLVNQGLTLKQRNFYTRYGEIDLVMNDSSQLIFVEVKFRKIMILAPQKRQLLRRNADDLLQLLKHT